MRDLRERFNLAYQTLGPERVNHYLVNTAKVLREAQTLRPVKDLDARIEFVIKEFATVSGHSVMNFARTLGFAEPLTYDDVLADAAGHLSVSPKGKTTIPRLETEITKDFLDKVWDRLNKKQRENLYAEIKKALGNRDHDFLGYAKYFSDTVPISVLLGLGVPAVLSFAATSVAVSAATATLGLTSVAEFLIGAEFGPLGIAAASAYTLYKFAQPSYEKKVIPCILLFAALRAEVEAGGVAVA